MLDEFHYVPLIDALYIHYVILLCASMIFDACVALIKAPFNIFDSSWCWLESFSYARSCGMSQSLQLVWFACLTLWPPGQHGNAMALYTITLGHFRAQPRRSQTNKQTNNTTTVVDSMPGTAANYFGTSSATAQFIETCSTKRSTGMPSPCIYLHQVRPQHK